MARTDLPHHPPGRVHRRRHPGPLPNGGSGTQALGPLEAGELLRVLKTVRKGSFSARMRLEGQGLPGEVAETLNDIIEMNERMALELERISRVVGKEGKLAQRASLGAVSGSWATSMDSVNSLIGDLVQPTTEVARVIG
ncbi:MAG TPA: hypothetical protein VNI01_09700, partial [Elusimicrobiota bacterium]|nr:hypothetical protein [Elusimicrobiota bacterium]